MKKPLVHTPSLDGLTDLLSGRKVTELTAGRYLLLHFMTGGCINCLHLIAETARYPVPEGLALVTVHSGKFEREKEDGWVRAWAFRHGLDHPVVNDADMRLWEGFAVRAWPTLVLVDPGGYEIGRASGEGTVAEMLSLYERAKKRAEESKKLPHRIRREPLDSYAFARVASDGKRLYLSDLGGRVVVSDLAGKVEKTFHGFAEPQGLTLLGGLLYVADRAAGEIVAVDPETGEKVVIASGFRSPTGLTNDGKGLQVALAGEHALLWLDPSGREIARAGRGGEGLRDGEMGREAQFAQPTDLAWLDEALYVVDAEASALRKIEEGRVETPVGWDLFTFGDRDGIGEEVRLQHPEGVCAGVGGCGNHRIFIADTYNDKVKVYDPLTGRVTTLVEKVEEPVGLVKVGCDLFIVQLGRNRILRFDISTLTSHTMEIKTLEGL
ncbi:hypothetical protein [Hydrogenimonas sp. SS33]|uniref:hypothetical protein n=1 Tax=Hydrogenimonas leucolamina TaxID=2954236 RepID=UPI00336BD6BC